MPTDGSNATSLADQLAMLHADDPPRYALLQYYLDALRDALEQSDRNYVSAKQLHSTWDDPPFQPQIVGQLLSTAADLGIIRVHTRRNNGNQYDLTIYDPTQLQHVLTLLERDTASAESEPDDSDH